MKWKIPQKNKESIRNFIIFKKDINKMDSNNKLAHKVKQQIGKFAGIITKGYSKPKKKFVKEMIYGIQASKDVKLSNISRSLNETIPLIKTENRLSRNLSTYDLTDDINQTICGLSSGRILEDTVIAIDPGDISKKYAKKMENLCTVHDGSENKLMQGYWTCQVVATNINDDDIIPLYCQAYSTESKDFTSANTQIIKAIDTVSDKVGNLGIWAIDRGGDSRLFYEKFVGEHKRFVVRLQKKRDIMYKGKYYNVAEFAMKIKCKNGRQIVYYKDGKEHVKNIYYGAEKIKLPDWDETFTLVVVKGFGKEAMMLLTNCVVIPLIDDSVWRIVDIYLARWKCEESYRYIKQNYYLEDIRVRSFVAIRNIVALLIAVAYFVTTYIGKNIKMKLSLQKIFVLSKRFFAIPAFCGYAIADGLHRLFFNCLKGINNTGFKLKKASDFQLSLPFD
jgi:hypothetical protein